MLETSPSLIILSDMLLFEVVLSKLIWLNNLIVYPLYTNLALYNAKMNWLCVDTDLLFLITPSAKRSIKDLFSWFYSSSMDLITVDLFFYAL